MQSIFFSLIIVVETRNEIIEMTTRKLHNADFAFSCHRLLISHTILHQTIGKERERVQNEEPATTRFFPHY